VDRKFMPVFSFCCHKLHLHEETTKGCSCWQMQDTGLFLVRNIKALFHEKNINLFPIIGNNH